MCTYVFTWYSETFANCIRKITLFRNLDMNFTSSQNTYDSSPNLIVKNYLVELTLPTVSHVRYNDQNTNDPRTIYKMAGPKTVQKEWYLRSSSYNVHRALDSTQITMKSEEKKGSGVKTGRAVSSIVEITRAHSPTSSADWGVSAAPRPPALPLITRNIYFNG